MCKCLVKVGLLLFSSDVLGKQQVTALPTHMGDSNEVVGSWFQPNPTLTAVGIWGINQQIDAKCLQSPHLSNKNGKK